MALLPNFLILIPLPDLAAYVNSFPGKGNPLPFLVRPEYTLSLIRLIRPSFKTHNRLLSEPSPYSYHNEVRGLVADCPIFHIFTIGFGN